MAFSNGVENSQAESGSRSRDSTASNRHSLFSFFEEPSAANTPLTRPSSFGLSQPSTSTTYTDARGNLQRRFTTTNAPNLFGSLSPIAQQRRQAAEFSPPDLSFAIKSQQGQRAQRMSSEHDFLRKKQLEFENAQNEIALLELQIQQRKEALRRDQADLRNPAGHQSEPTTPPEYRDSGFPTSLSKPNRFSASNIASPPGVITRPSRAGSQAMSPPSDQRAAAYQALTGSMPQTRDNSDEGEEDPSEDMWERGHRSAKSLNRNSMPVTRRDHTRGGFADFASAFGPVNTTAFLFDDENDKNAATSNSTSNRSSFVRSGILQANTNEDQFPVLLRRGTDSKMPPSTSSGIEEAHNSASSSNIPITRARPLSYSQGVKMNSRSNTATVIESPTSHTAQPSASGSVTPTRTNRHSMGPRIGAYSENNQRPSLVASPGSSADNSRAAPRLQSSYSTNDIPTVNNTSGVPAQPGAVASPEERLHNHNASLGRIPTGAIRSNRTSRDLSELTRSPEMRFPELRGEDSATPSIQSVLQQSAPINTGTSQATAGANALNPAQPFSQQAFAGFNNNAAFYAGYSLQGHPAQQGTHGLNGMNGMNALVNGLNGMSLGGAGQWNGNMPQQNMFGASLYGAYNPYNNQQGHFSQGPQGRNNSFQPRRTAGEEQARFQNIPLETLHGEIYSLCRDQHGCRYLQKKLEEARPDQTNLIFNEVNAYMFELMTDPFGNYLVQKLLEQCTEEQRTTLIENASAHMIHIALNQHGTRALQKMIDFVSTPIQVQRVIESLQPNVVGLIQDLNGNHVIQKCLNRLSSADAQFIFDSVATECVRVGTHRHGCCVIQRCIDHAEGPQKAALVLAIVDRADQLVGDPFGNYVLQYIFEQGEDAFSTPLCNQFKGSMADYSKQKFSSNVVEKAIRIADEETKQHLIHELVHSPSFESVADDAFGNYVLQTAWDYAKGDDEHALVDKIRPLLARGMRSKPHGRRFASRLSEYDQRNGNNPASASISAPSTQPFAPAMPHLGFGGQPQQATNFTGHGNFGQAGNMFQTPPASSHGTGLNGTTSPPYSGYTSPNGYNASYNGNNQFSGSAQQGFSRYGAAHTQHSQPQQGGHFY